MNTYEVTFSTGDISSCIELKSPPDFDGDLCYKTNGKLLLSACIRADSEADARSTARDLMDAFAAVS